MAKQSKRQRAIAERVEAGKAYAIDEAVGLLSDLSSGHFKESFDVSVNLGLDVRKADQAMRGATALPHGVGKPVRVAVFAQGEDAAKAEAAGADLVGLEDLAQRVEGGDLGFDLAIAAPDAMRVVGRLGRILGPRGLMPNPKTGTVARDVETAVKNAKAGQIRYRTDRSGIIHGSIGRVGFSAVQVKENLEALVKDLLKVKPASAKGVYLRRITLSTSMGPGLAIDQSSLAI